MAEKYPMKLLPAMKSTIWGGTHLKEMFGKEAPFDTLGETWELTVRPDGMSTIENGTYAGKPLSAYLDDAGNSAIAADYKGDRFPLLIKFLDASDKLSIQVHPDDAYALANEGELGKTEMWYILAADKDAEIIYGLKDGITVEDFAKAVASGHTEEMMNYVKVKPGDVFFIPSGQVHALGKGIVVAEIQQNSNVTYRVYDFNRRQADGSMRQLHTAKAIDVIRLRNNDEIDKLRFSAGDTSDGSLLAHCDCFKVSKYDIIGAKMLYAEDESFVSLLCVDGVGVIVHNGRGYTLKSGDSYFIPSGTGAFTVYGKLSIIESKLK